MRNNYWLSILILGWSALGCSQAAQTATQEVAVPNFDADSPACMVKVPLVNSRCTAEGCTLPAPAGATLEAIWLNFSCLPTSAPTGFENPAPEVKVQSIRSKNAKGHLSLIDDMQSPADERLRELKFCLYGKLNNFCGNAKVLRLKDGSKMDGSAAVKTFIKGIELVTSASN
jgi:hypothetical protein